MMKPQASNAPDRVALDGRLSFTAAAAAPTAASAAWSAVPETGALEASAAAHGPRARRSGRALP